MKIFITTIFLSSVLAAGAIAQQKINQPTGIDVKGCTYYKIVNNKVVCSPEWKDGYKQTRGQDGNGD